MAERTRIWIADAMRRLMEKKPLDKIRVTDICREAEIGRPAFYYHFKDKYDLVTWIFLYSVHKTDIISVSSAVEHLKQMKKDFTFYKRAFEESSQIALWKYIFEYFVERYTKIAKLKLGSRTLEEPIEFAIRLYCYGTIGITQEWLLRDTVTPAEKIASLMFSSMPQQLREIYFEEKTD
ncbi:TetR/AcrR family transcriptional regulator C-terminal domain-containing protein [Succinivibrio sp.]|uniref:TetR/AcrR family transcriptional regulator C-terminal domain-containing protein n=1 Tax=Succinivibrio sp. TaxID=2053619 RepID=UPI0025D5A05E|nr:TetR/AcrR family transcriptional regulator C-terminal domain-containing protein [Succinivibrio sp.]MBQ9221506.1 TetR/AcrR family transcriptional regulator C-terminal domain-containing protein [Succinivibrio sp.]